MLSNFFTRLFEKKDSHPISVLVVKANGDQNPIFLDVEDTLHLYRDGDEVITLIYTSPSRFTILVAEEKNEQPRNEAVDGEDLPGVSGDEGSRE